MPEPARPSTWSILTGNYGRGDCQACRDRGPLIDSDPHKCAFRCLRFSDRNWNCATVNLIRYLAESFTQHCGDESFAAIPLPPHFDHGAVALWVLMLDEWRRSRGIARQVRHARDEIGMEVLCCDPMTLRTSPYDE